MGGWDSFGVDREVTRSEKNILYEVGSFKLHAAQLVSIFTIILLTYINSRGVKNSKSLQTFLTIKILRELSFTVFLNET